MAVNSKRVLIGALAGGLVWNLWTFFINGIVLKERYEAAGAANLLLEKPRYGILFPLIWTAMIFVLAWIIASLYAATRAAWGAGPMTALKVGVMFGFAVGFPLNFAAASWAVYSRWLPLGWTLDFFFGALLAAVIAGWLYHD